MKFTASVRRRAREDDGGNNACVFMTPQTLSVGDYPPDLAMSGRCCCTYLVTGAASGLGRAAAELLFRRGHNVALCDRDDAEELVRSLSDIVQESAASLAPPPRAMYAHMDVTDASNVREVVRRIVAEFGALHGVVNCAGVATVGLTVGGDGEAADPAAFEIALRVNLLGTFLVSSACAAAMARLAPDAEGGRGCIITVASVAGLEGQRGQVAYAASKGGVIGMTLPMARDLGRHGIRVMCIAPGVIDTPMMQAASEAVKAGLLRSLAGPRRFGRPDEFAALCAHIFENGYLNGEVIRLDAGVRFANL